MIVLIVYYIYYNLFLLLYYLLYWIDYSILFCYEEKEKSVLSPHVRNKLWRRKAATLSNIYTHFLVVDWLINEQTMTLIINNKQRADKTARDVPGQTGRIINNRWGECWTRREAAGELSDWNTTTHFICWLFGHLLWTGNSLTVWLQDNRGNLTVVWFCEQQVAPESHETLDPPQFVSRVTFTSVCEELLLIRGGKHINFHLTRAFLIIATLYFTLTHYIYLTASVIGYLSYLDRGT